jgi:hypothetical protein
VIHGHGKRANAIATPRMIRCATLRIYRAQSLWTEIESDPFIYEL